MMSLVPSWALNMLVELEEPGIVFAKHLFVKRNLV